MLSPDATVRQIQFLLQLCTRLRHKCHSIRGSTIMRYSL